jgi:DNA-binding transcriptional LysR family regulator
MYTAAALAGLGIIQVPRYRVAAELADGRLKIVLPKLAPPSMPVSVLYPQNRQLSSRVRVFAQWLRGIFEAAGFDADEARD